MESVGRPTFWKVPATQRSGSAPFYLVHELTPRELLAAWEAVVGPAETDLTDEEWQLLVPLFGSRRGRWDNTVPRSNRELEVKRRVFDGIRFKMAHHIQWQAVPDRYDAASVYFNYRRYQKIGLFDRLYQALRSNSQARRIVEWLEQIVDTDQATSHAPTKVAP